MFHGIHFLQEKAGIILGDLFFQSCQLFVYDIQHMNIIFNKDLKQPVEHGFRCLFPIFLTQTVHDPLQITVKIRKTDPVLPYDKGKLGKGMSLSQQRHSLLFPLYFFLLLQGHLHLYQKVVIFLFYQTGVNGLRIDQILFFLLPCIRMDITAAILFFQQKIHTKWYLLSLFYLLVCIFFYPVYTILR